MHVYDLPESNTGEMGACGPMSCIIWRVLLFPEISHAY